MEAFNTYGLVKKVVERIPPKQLAVRYGNTEVYPGITLTPSMTKSYPQIRFDNEPGVFYALIMNDPDFPSRSDPKFAEFSQWLVLNIHDGDVNKGDAIHEYTGPLPSRGTGHHRYVFMLYKQPRGRIDVSGMKKLNSRSWEGRKNQSMKEFAKKYQLQDATFGNFFQCEWDDYVTKAQEQMKM